MRKVSITEAKNGLSALIDSLKGGTRFLIVDRGRPVARLEPVAGDSDDEHNGRLARLVREGIVRPGRAALPQAFFSEQLPHSPGDVSNALIEERRESR